MSVAEIAPRNDDFERTPPHDVAAEQCVLGGMLLSKDAISDVIEVIHPADHYRPAHQLDPRGDPRPVRPGRAGRRRSPWPTSSPGAVRSPGSAARPYLHTLIASVPTAANAGYYARIVRERAVLRRLVEAGTRIVQLGYAGRRRRRRPRRPGPGRGLRGHRAPDQRGLRLAVGDHARRAGRDRGDRQPQRDADRRPDRLRRPGRPHQRPAPGPDDRHRRPSRHG